MTLRTVRGACRRGDPAERSMGAGGRGGACAGRIVPVKRARFPRPLQRAAHRVRIGPPAPPARRRRR